MMIANKYFGREDDHRLEVQLQQWSLERSSLFVMMTANDCINREDAREQRSLIATMVARAFKFCHDDDLERVFRSRR